MTYYIDYVNRKVVSSPAGRALMFGLRRIDPVTHRAVDPLLYDDMPLSPAMIDALLHGDTATFRDQLRKPTEAVKVASHSNATHRSAIHHPDIHIRPYNPNSASQRTVRHNLDSPAPPISRRGWFAPVTVAVLIIVAGFAGFALATRTHRGNNGAAGGNAAPAEAAADAVHAVGVHCFDFNPASSCRVTLSDGREIAAMPYVGSTAGGVVATTTFTEDQTLRTLCVSLYRSGYIKVKHC